MTGSRIRFGITCSMMNPDHSSRSRICFLYPILAYISMFSYRVLCLLGRWEEWPLGVHSYLHNDKWSPMAALA